jgi:C1A family cysteine protease
MKFTFLLLCLASTLTLQSCGQNNSSQTSTFRGKVVLGAFSDNISDSTFDETLLTDLPRMVDLKSDMTKVKNQSSRGTCTFFSTMGLIESTIKKDLQLDVNLSEEYLNYLTKSKGYFNKSEGSTVNSNLYSIFRGGVLLERDWGYQPSWFGPKLPCQDYNSTDTSAPAQCFSHNAPDEETMTKVIDTSAIEYNLIQKNTNEIIKFLANNKRPLTMSVTVNYAGWPDTGDVFYNDELRAQCIATSSECGGHSILLTGYDLDKKIFFFKNSWGTSWGHDGYGTISIATVDRYVTDALYYAKAVSPIIFPEDFNKDNFELTNFDLEPISVDGNLKIKITAGLKGLKGHTAYISSFLSKKSKLNLEDASDLNTQSVRLDELDGISKETYARGFEYFLPMTPTDSLVWNNESPLLISYPENILKTPTVNALLLSNDEDTMARTTIYVHTDDSAFKVLKRIYHPIK